MNFFIVVLLYVYFYIILKETQSFQKSVVEFLPNIYEALSPIPNAAERKRTKPDLTKLVSKSLYSFAKPTNVKIGKYLLVLQFSVGVVTNDLFLHLGRICQEL